MKNLLLIAFIILTNISFSQTWTLVGKTSSKLFKKGTGIYELKYKSEYDDYIFTDKLTRTSRVEGKEEKYFRGEEDFWLSKEQKNEMVPAVIENYKCDDPDYVFMVFWANIIYSVPREGSSFPNRYNAKGYIVKISILGEITDIWMIL